MKRKKILKIGLASAFAFFLALTGCAKADNGVQKPIDNNDETVEPIENSEEAQAKHGYIEELTITKKSPYVNSTATMQFSGVENDTLDDTNKAAAVGLNSTIFTINGNKGGTNYLPALNTDGTIRLYSNRNTGDGSYIDISVNSGYQIVSITISYKTTSSYTVPTVIVGEDIVEPIDGSFDIDASSVRVKNAFNAGGSDNKQVHINSIVIAYEGEAKDVADCYSTRSSLSYCYSKEINNIADTLNSAFIGVGSYADWSNKTGESGIKYAGNTSGASSKIWLRSSSNSGIVTTNNSKRNNLKKITITWHDSTDDGRQIDIYAKETAYSAPSDLYNAPARGTCIKSFVYDKTSGINTVDFTFDGTYKFIGIRSNGNSLYVSSIEIEWEVPTFTYSDIAIRFGGLVKKTLWDRLESESDIQGYGVMLLSTPDFFDDLEQKTLEAWYNSKKTGENTIDEALALACDGTDIRNFPIRMPEDKENPALATAVQKGDLTGDYYIWNLYKTISVSPDNRKTSYTAVAYIRLADELVFMDEATASVKSMAQDLIADNPSLDATYDATLDYLANLA